MSPNLLPATVIGVLAAAAVIFPRAAAVAAQTQQFVLEFEMAASTAAVAEVFFDRGAGVEVNRVLPLPIDASAEPRRYIVPIAPGRYHAVRLDPLPDAGDFVLQHATIRDRHGRTIRQLPLNEFERSAGIVIRELTASRMAAAVSAGHADPQLRYRFERTLFLWLSRQDLLALAASAVFIASVVGAAAFVLLRLDRPLMWRAPRWRLLSRPRQTLLLAAAVSTVLATYPLLFGRSLVTPNNGPTAFVYNAAPFAADGSDTDIEVTRADVKATMLVTLPYAVVQREALAHGEWPFWNRYVQNGIPLLGQGQSAFFDPLQWLLLVGDLALGADLKFIAGRFVFTAGAALAAFAASGSLSASVLIALTAPFIGHFIGRLNDPIHFSIVYAPWILVAYAALLRAPLVRTACLPAAGMLLATALTLFASSPKEAFAVLPGMHVAGVAAILVEAFRTSAWRPAAIRLALAATAAAGAALLTAPHWLVFLETLGNAFTAYEIEAFDFARLSHAVSMVAGAFYPGIIYAALNPVTAALVMLAVCVPRRAIAHPLAAGCAIAGTAMLAIAFGVVPEALLKQLPLFPRIHHVGSTFLTAALPLLLVVAAAGCASLATVGADQERRGAAAGVIAAVALTVGLAYASDLTEPNLGFAFAACVWTGGLCYLLPAASQRRGRLVMLVTAIVIVVLLLPGGLHGTTGSRAIDTLLVQPRQRTNLTAMPPELVAASGVGEPARIAGLNGALQGGVASYLGLEGMTGADALFSPHTGWIGKQFDPNYPLMLRAADARGERLAPLLDLWGVRWLARPGGARSPGRNTLDLHERPTAWPRAFFVDRLESHADSRAFLRRLLADARPFASIYAGDATANGIGPAVSGPATTVAPARDYHLTANTTSFTITAPAAGVIVLNENYWPGVAATVSERAASVFRVNETMRAIRVEAGTSRITFSYRPATWGIATGLAAAGVMVLLALVGATVRGQGSGIRNQESGIRDQESRVRDQVSGIRGQGSGVRSQGSGRCQVAGIGR